MPARRDEVLSHTQPKTTPEVDRSRFGRRVLHVALFIGFLGGLSAPGDAAERRGFLVDFYGRNCGPCQAMMPLVDRLRAEGQPIHKVCVEERRDLQAKYGVQNVPTLILFVDNEEVQRVEGAIGEGELRRMLGQIPAGSVSRPKKPAVVSSLPEVEEPQTLDRRQFAATEPRRSRPPARRGTESLRDATVRANLDAGSRRPSRAIADVGPMAASVRIRIDDGLISYGSGTVVESKPGRTLILTCGHLFRDISDEATLEVEFFRGGRVVRTVGRALDYDLKADVGLIEVPTDEVWPAAPVATTGEAPSVGDSTITIGCSGGEDPTIEPTQITALNRYLGPENIEVQRMPVQGRSGGGLFDSTGRVVGICIGQCADTQRGLYAGLGAVHDLLDDNQLAAIYRDDVSTDRNPIQLVADADHSAPADRASLGAVAMGTPAGNDLPNASRLSESRARAGDEASDDDLEVVCIVRSKSDPTGQSRVVIIDRADEALLERILGPQRNQLAAEQVRTAER